MLSVCLLAALALALTGSPLARTADPGRADFDGDGRLDTASIRHRGPAGNDAPWYLVVTLANGRRVVHQMRNQPAISDKTSAPCFLSCDLIGTHDLDGDGRSEVAVERGGSASDQAFVLFHLVDRRLRQIRFDAHGQRRFAVFWSGAGARFGERLICRGRDVVDTEWGLADRPSRHWDVTEHVYRLRADVLVLLRDRRIDRPYSGTGVPWRGRPCDFG